MNRGIELDPDDRHRLGQPHAIELDVARRVAEASPIPEIGARLFISRATVKTHLSHIYAKLNVGNRTDLATLAAETGTYNVVDDEPLTKRGCADALAEAAGTTPWLRLP